MSAEAPNPVEGFVTVAQVLPKVLAAISSNARTDPPSADPITIVDVFAKRVEIGSAGEEVAP